MTGSMGLGAGARSRPSFATGCRSLQSAPPCATREEREGCARTAPPPPPQRAPAQARAGAKMRESNINEHAAPLLEPAPLRTEGALGRKSCKQATPKPCSLLGASCPAQRAVARPQAGRQAGRPRDPWLLGGARRRRARTSWLVRAVPARASRAASRSPRARRGGGAPAGREHRVAPPCHARRATLPRASPLARPDGPPPASSSPLLLARLLAGSARAATHVPGFCFAKATHSSLPADGTPTPGSCCAADSVPAQRARSCACRALVCWRPARVLQGCNYVPGFCLAKATHGSGAAERTPTHPAAAVLPTPCQRSSARERAPACLLCRRAVLGRSTMSRRRRGSFKPWLALAAMPAHSGQSRNALLRCRATVPRLARARGVLARAGGS